MTFFNSNESNREFWWKLMPNLFFFNLNLTLKEENELRDMLALICAEHIKLETPQNKAK